MTTELLADLLEFAAVPAPTFAEEPRLAWLERRLAHEPGRRERDAAGNLLWRFGEGPTRLLLLAHVDTVFPSDVPLTFERRNGRLSGPGIGDNAVAVVAVIHALSGLLVRGVEPAGAVAFTVGEEGLGDLRGAHQACEQLRPACVIAVEGHGLERVLVDAVGSVRLRLRVGGPGGHSWENRGTPSAIHALLQVGARLTKLGSRETPINIGLVSGGQSINSIASAAELVVEMRALDESALERFEADICDLALDPPLSIVAERVGRRPAGRLDRNHPLLQTIRSVRATLGLPDELGAGSTDANAALVRAIPAVTLGIARGGSMHTPNEWLEEASIALGLRQLDAVLAALLGPLDGSSDPG